MDGKKIFEGVKGYTPQFSSFDLSYEYKGSGNFGLLMPVFLQDVIPGDRFKVNTEVMVRFAPMLAPIMQRVDVYMHYFYCPNRILWTEWEDFFTGGDDGTSAPTFPTLDLTTFGAAALDKGTLLDYMGIPQESGAPSQALSISKLPIAAYYKVWDEYHLDRDWETHII